MRTKEANPSRDCSICPRLKKYIDAQRLLEPDWHNAPVDTWTSSKGDEDVELLIIGLAPGMRGANRTGLIQTTVWNLINPLLPMLCDVCHQKTNQWVPRLTIAGHS